MTLASCALDEVLAPIIANRAYSHRNQTFIINFPTRPRHRAAGLSASGITLAAAVALTHTVDASEGKSTKASTFMASIKGEVAGDVPCEEWVRNMSLVALIDNDEPTPTVSN